MHIVLAGFGNMGRALARGWLEGDSPEARISILDTDVGARTRATSMGFAAFSSAAEIEGKIDVVVLAVKPAQIGDALGELRGADLYISIAAGKTIADIANVVGGDAAIVRAMPNTPAAIGFGVTGLVANDNVGPHDKTLATALMSAVGGVEWLDDEADMDTLTAISGSGPAYVFLLIECLTAAGAELGLEPDLAERLATATVRGAGAYADLSDRDAATLRREVTSPKGTTEAALAVLQEGGGLQALIGRAVRAAARRSREIGSSGTGTGKRNGTGKK